MSCACRKFLTSTTLQRSFFDAWSSDNPLTVQFCANDPDELVAAAKLVQHACVAVDINLGCPQGIARKGFYGAFLLEHVELVAAMVKRCAEELTVPVTCKIRVLPDEADTMRLVDAIVEAGASLLTVHGRTRQENKTLAVEAHWDAIRAIKQRVPIPVIANGGMFNQADIARCLHETGADGVMLSEAVLENPSVFSGGVHLPSGRVHNALDMTWRYLEIAEAVGARWKHVQGHTLKMLYGGLSQHADLQQALPKVPYKQQYAGVRRIVRELAARFDVPLHDTPLTHTLLPPDDVSADRILWQVRSAAQEAFMAAQTKHDRANMTLPLVRARDEALAAAAAAVMEHGKVRVPCLPLPVCAEVAAAAMRLPAVPTAHASAASRHLAEQAAAVQQPPPAEGSGLTRGQQPMPPLCTPRPYFMREVVAWASGDRVTKAAMELAHPTDITFPRPGMWYYRHAPRVIAAALAPCATAAEAMLDIAMARAARFRTHVVRDAGALKAYLLAKHGQALGVSSTHVHPCKPPCRGYSVLPASLPAVYSCPPSSAASLQEDEPALTSARAWLEQDLTRIPSSMREALAAEMVPLPIMDAEQALALARGTISAEELGGPQAGEGADVIDGAPDADEAPTVGMAHLFGEEGGDDEFEE